MDENELFDPQDGDAKVFDDEITFTEDEMVTVLEDKWLTDVLIRKMYTRTEWDDFIQSVRDAYHD